MREESPFIERLRIEKQITHLVLETRYSSLCCALSYLQDYYISTGCPIVLGTIKSVDCATVMGPPVHIQMLCFLKLECLSSKPT